MKENTNIFIQNFLLEKKKSSCVKESKKEVEKREKNCRNRYVHNMTKVYVYISYIIYIYYTLYNVHYAYVVHTMYKEKQMGLKETH